MAGWLPEIAARAHVETSTPSPGQALAEAGVTPSDLDASPPPPPGLVGGVMVGCRSARPMAWPRAAADRRNHLEGHAVSARLTADLP